MFACQCLQQEFLVDHLIPPPEAGAGNYLECVMLLLASHYVEAFNFGRASLIKCCGMKRHKDSLATLRAWADYVIMSMECFTKFRLATRMLWNVVLLRPYSLHAMQSNLWVNVGLAIAAVKS